MVVQYENKFNIGHLITAVPTVIALCALIWWQASFQSEARLRFNQSDASRALYIPLINAMVVNNGIQDTRIAQITENVNRLSDAVTDVSRSRDEVKDKLVELALALAQIQTSISVNGARLPPLKPIQESIISKQGEPNAN